jgi:hypothetical protein
MNKFINFADNIYVLFTRIRMIRELFVLDADPGLFMNKTFDDIEFIDKTLDAMLNELKNNSKLIEREELLSHLAELEWQFGQVLSEFLNIQKALPAEENPAMKGKIAAFQVRSLERKKTAEVSITIEERAESGKTQEPLVSASEYNDLLKAL